MAAAEAGETSCSPERPPYTTPMRSRFTAVPLSKAPPSARRPAAATPAAPAGRECA